MTSRRTSSRIAARWWGLALLALSLALPVAAQQQAAPGRGETVADTLEAIQHARVVTRVLFIVAHPDDEASTLLTYLPHGLGTDTTLLTLTRGDGGQNAIGPEQGAQLAILRSAELSGAMEFEGPHLYFTRATDFGFSKTLEETLEQWKGIALPDMVRVIRTLRPTIVINGWGGTHNGHGNHQASGVLTPQAVEAAADPKQFPEQLAEGLKPWRVEMVLDPVRAQTPNEKVDYTNSWTVPADEISPLWGRSYREISLEGYIHHRSQGVTPNLNSPFFRQTYALRRADKSGPLTPADLAQPLTALARLLPVPSADALAAIDRALDQAALAARNLDWPGSVRLLAEAGKQINSLEQAVRRTQDARTADAEWELQQVRDHINHALADAAAIKIVSNADRSELVAGEKFTVRADLFHRSGAPAVFSKPDLILPDGWTAAIAPPPPPAGRGGGNAPPPNAPPPTPPPANAEDNSINLSVTVPASAQTPHAPGDWMYPFPLPLVQAHSHVIVEGYGFDYSVPVVSRQSNSVTVMDYPLRIVPPVSLTVEPDQFVIVEGRQPKQMDVFARVHSFAQTPAKVSVGMEVPSGWKASEPETVDFSTGNDLLVRMAVTPPLKIPTGTYALKAYAKRGNDKYETSLEPLPSLPTYLWNSPTAIPVHTFAINVPDHLHVGYIAAGTDAVPASLQRLGVDLEMLDANALAFGDLHRFDAIVVGLRAYELRADVVAANRRLLDYAANGGTLVVQDQLPRVWDPLKLAPFPATIGPGPRITYEDAAVKFTDPASPLLNFPNKITDRDFDAWVQERGLYFWEKWDPQYHTVLSMHDPGEMDLTGGLVWTRTGKGVYIYTGLSFSRQLPAGNPGAFRLFVNLISQSRAKTK